MADPAESTDTVDEDAEAVRTALLDQLRYLVDEIEALKTIVERVPEPVREGRPTPDALSMKEIYGVIARMDECVHRPRIERITRSGDEVPVFEPLEESPPAADEDWNAMPMRDILERVQSARQGLVTLLDNLPAADWAQTGRFGDEEYSVYEIAHRITQNDVQRLRMLSHRLYEANLSGRARDLPT